MSLDQRQRHAAFLAAHPAAEIVFNWTGWRYLRGGEGDAVLLLTGALGAADLGFHQIEALEAEFRVLAPHYPPAHSLEAMVDGMIAILDAEGAERAHVVAGSFGGMIAQELVRRHPERVRSLVLSHTAAPNPKARGGGVLLRVLSLVPEGLLRRMFTRKLGPSFDGADPFWRRYFDATMARLRKADFLSRVRIANEFQARRHTPRDLDGWPGRVLIVEADHDPLFAAEGQAAVRALYPNAEVHTFRGTGHAAAILQPDVYAAVVRDFLLRAG